MLYQKRRDFIRKSLIGGLLSAFQLPLLAAGDNPLLPSLSQKGISFTPRSEEDWVNLRELFTLQEDPLYLNSAGLGPSPIAVVESYTSWIQKLEVICDTGRKFEKTPHRTFDRFFGVDDFSMAVTRNTTEGINIAARCLPIEKGDEIILTRHEHIGGSAPWLALHKEGLVSIKLVELDLTGKDNLKIIQDAVSERTKVVAFSHITCTNGMRLPAKEIAAWCREKGIYTCVDGAQSAGMIEVNLKDMNPDFYCTSGHKWLMGPKGSGLLYINPAIISEIDPIFVGAYTDSTFDLANLSMEYIRKTTREEYGTRNTPRVMSLETACKFITELGLPAVEKRGMELAGYLKAQLSEIPEIEILSPMDPAYSSAIVTFRIRGFEFKSAHLELIKTYRCRTRAIFENDLKAIRVSCGIYNSMADMDTLVDSIKKLIKS